jgi:large subunit ribosomal protein L4|eukprot:GHVR01046871.1.p1 GENE.GHVR01046871.1~~GHVR01046871.1.p1  ORF type:complete len:207 (+),score=26.21 GHVR01046871.1:282-902(+)
MYLEVLNSENKILRKIEANIFDIENIRHDLIHQLVLWQQAKKRSPISHTKEISEVRGSTRKIYRQKGTGKARHGSIRGAQFVGGGIIFGPNKNKVYEYKVNKKVKKMALLNALALKFKDKSIIVHEHLKLNTNKSKDFLNMYGDKILSEKILFIDSNFDDNFVKSIRNNHKVDKLCLAGINVLDIIKHDKIYFSEDAFNNVLARFK